VRALAQEAVGESAGQLRKGQQGVAQGLDLGIGEAQRRGALLVDLTGTIELLESLFRQHAVVGDSLHFQ
jgi:hypothetical protein